MTESQQPFWKQGSVGGNSSVLHVLLELMPHAVAAVTSPKRAAQVSGEPLVDSTEEFLGLLGMQPLYQMTLRSPSGIRGVERTAGQQRHEEVHGGW